MTQYYARISRENLPVPLKLESIIISYPLWIGLKYGDSFEHWLVMYLLKYWFRIIFNQKKLRTAALSKSDDLRSHSKCFSIVLFEEFITGSLN